MTCGKRSGQTVWSLGVCVARFALETFARRQHIRARVSDHLGGHK